MLDVAGADRLITMDLHSGQIQGFFDGPVDHLTAMPVLGAHIRASCEGRDLVVVAPDAGRVRTAEKMAGQLGAPWPSSTSGAAASRPTRSRSARSWARSTASSAC